MSWVTLDDAAPLHRKQVSVGMRACWVWTCGLAYCDRQEAKDGFIPDAVVKLLYPGVTAEDVRRLVAAVLWHKVDGGYQVHEYSEWRAKRFAGVQSGRGSAGGQVKSEAKRTAALEREHKKRLAQQTTTSDHNESTTTDHNNDHDENTTKPPAIRSDPIRTDPNQTTTSIGDLEDPGRETVCPLNLLEKLENNGTIARLAEQIPAPIEAVRACIRAFVATWTIGKLAGQRRSGWSGKARQWVIDQHAQGKLKGPEPVSGTGLDPEAQALLQRLRAIP